MGRSAVLSCLLLVCTVSQSHLHDYQHFADLGTVMVWCGLDGGEWRSLCGSSFSQVRLTLPVAVSPEPVPDTFRWLYSFSQATALLAIAAADYKNEKKKKKSLFIRSREMMNAWIISLSLWIWLGYDIMHVDCRPIISTFEKFCYNLYDHLGLTLTIKKWQKYIVFTFKSIFKYIWQYTLIFNIN